MMKAFEVIEKLTEGAFRLPNTCDTIKAGDSNKEVKKLALSMFATIDVVKQAKEWGADMLVVHEPTYYDHMDVMIDTPLTRAKKELIEKSGMVIFRYHDCMHARIVDQVLEGELYYLGLKGQVERSAYNGSYIVNLEEEITAEQLVKRMQEERGLKHVKIAGSMDHKSKRIGACFGTPAGVFELLCDESIDMVLTGEVCEWKHAEYARDSALLGIPKSLIVMGHIGSERDGVRLLEQKIKASWQGVDVKYFECGEVYSYVD